MCADIRAPGNEDGHYSGKYEPIDFILDRNLDFVEGSILKYLCRWRFKGGVEDLKKALWYAAKLRINRKRISGLEEIPLEAFYAQQLDLVLISSFIQSLFSNTMKGRETAYQYFLQELRSSIEKDYA